MFDLDRIVVSLIFAIDDGLIGAADKKMLTPVRPNKCWCNILLKWRHMNFDGEDLRKGFKFPTYGIHPRVFPWFWRMGIKTLLEAQRTQGIDSTFWVNLSARIVQDWFLELVANLVTRWRHLNYFQIWSPDGATCINSNWIIYKFGHQIGPFALVQNLVTRWRHLH